MTNPSAILPLVSVCAWCQRERGEKPSAQETHTICQRHRIEVLADAGIDVRQLAKSAPSVPPPTSALAGDAIAAAEFSKFTGAASPLAPAYFAKP